MDRDLARDEQQLMLKFELLVLLREVILKFLPKIRPRPNVLRALARSSMAEFPGCTHLASR